MGKERLAMEKKTIGILGGMGPLATVDLYQKIVDLTDAACDNDHIRVYIDSNAQIPDRTAAILSGGPDPVPVMADSVAKLTACGADCIIMPCNTAHYFLPRLQPLTPVPFLSMLAAAANACRTRFPGQTAAVLATRGTLATGLYDQALTAEGVPFLLPSEEEKDVLMGVIYDGVKHGADLAPMKGDFEAALEAMIRRGAGYFILGCTELPLAFRMLHLPFPAVDPTEELARAAITFCGYPLRANTRL